MVRKTLEPLPHEVPRQEVARGVIGGHPAAVGVSAFVSPAPPHSAHFPMCPSLSVEQRCGLPEPPGQCVTAGAKARSFHSPSPS